MSIVICDFRDSLRSISLPARHHIRAIYPLEELVDPSDPTEQEHAQPQM